MTSAFQATDLAVVRAWLADATLGTSLAAIYTWEGFFGPAQEADADLTVPVVPPGKPRAGAFWGLPYRDEVKPHLSGDPLSRWPVLTVVIRAQPDGTAASYDKALAAWSAITSRLQTLSSGSAFVDEAGALAPQGSVDGWPEYVGRLTCFMS